ncbi:nectin-2-like [Sardina pilchardus]|uniref:nectin-2-like n=1 Tax=Sardina pilchardus TaxID=27697 RepID=UPI002E158194
MGLQTTAAGLVPVFTLPALGWAVLTEALSRRRVSRPRALGQLIQVKPEVMSYPGQNVELPCKFVNPGSTRVSQVSWFLEPSEAERINIAVFHPAFGASYPDSPVKDRVTFTAPTLDTPSIQISDVKMADEGRYICEYATYPTGHAQGITNLVMLAKPENSGSAVTVVAGDKSVVVAQCESANGRPASKIRWVTSVNGNVTMTTTQEPDNTVSVSSDYRLTPTPADNGKDISCVVEHRTQAKPNSFPMKLAIKYLPMVSIEGYDNNWYMGRTNVELTCQAKSNPIPTTITWRMLAGHMPDMVQVTENKLKVLKVDETVNTTFICEVRNRLGVGKNQVTVNVRAEAPELMSQGPLQAMMQQPERRPEVLKHRNRIGRVTAAPMMMRKKQQQ